MKPFFLSVCLFLAQYFAGIDFYNISIESLDGTQTKMSAYQGKKIIIAVVSGNDESIKLVKYLDSVQHANTDIQVIAIPTGDFNGGISARSLNDLRKNISIVVTKPLKVRRANGVQQHPLFAWLTRSSENKHFNMDAEGEGQVFIISGKGTLYGVLPKGTPWKYISKAINQPFNE